MPLPNRWLLGLMLVVLAITSGCRSGSSGDGGKVTNAQVLSRLYGKYIQKNKGAPPKNAEALKAFARKMSADDLKSAGATPDNLDAVFTSPRDNKPYIFRDPAKYKYAPGSEVVVIYEQDGASSTRVVIYPTGRSEEVATGKFKELVPEAN